MATTLGRQLRVCSVLPSATEMLCFIGGATSVGLAQGFVEVLLGRMLNGVGLGVILASAGLTSRLVARSALLRGGRVRDVGARSAQHGQNDLGGADHVLARSDRRVRVEVVA